MRQMHIFMGEYLHSMDAKGRIIIPAKLREGLGDSCVITKGRAECLTIYTKERFTEEAKRLEATAHTVKVMGFLRRFFSRAMELEFDRQGRVLVPPNLRAEGNLEKDVVIIGLNDRIEMWNKDQWNQYMAEQETELENLDDDLDAIGLF